MRCMNLGANHGGDVQGEPEALAVDLCKMRHHIGDLGRHARPVNSCSLSIAVSYVDFGTSLTGHGN